MYTIDIDFEVFKTPTSLRDSDATTCDDLVRELLVTGITGYFIRATEDLTAEALAGMGWISREV